MKHPFIFFILLSSIGLYGQLDQLPGNYYHAFGEGDQEIAYTLTLNAEGTFMFHSSKKVENSTAPEEHSYGRGRWTIDMIQNFSTMGFIVEFSADPVSDINGKYNLDFNGSKARFVFKSQRNKTDKDIPTRLQFFESNIEWMERVALVKEDP